MVWEHYLRRKGCSALLLRRASAMAPDSSESSTSRDRRASPRPLRRNNDASYADTHGESRSAQRASRHLHRLGRERFCVMCIIDAVAVCLLLNIEVRDGSHPVFRKCVDPSCRSEVILSWSPLRAFSLLHVLPSVLSLLVPSSVLCAQNYCGPPGSNHLTFFFSLSLSANHLCLV